MSRARKRPSTLLTVPLAAVLGAGLCLALPDDPRLWDALGRALPAEDEGRVLIVGIDDASLRDYGRIGAWPRELYAQALGVLQQAGVRAIGLNVLLGDPAPGDEALRPALSREGVVLAEAPGEAPLPAGRGWSAPRGVSALNISPDGVVRYFQTAYREGAEVRPSFARQLAVAAGQTVALDETPRLLRAGPTPRTLSFRDVVSDDVRYAELQGRVVVVGLTAGGAAGPVVRDSGGRVVPAVEMQARAVAALLGAPLTRVPPLLTLLLGVGLAVGAVLSRGLWGFGLATLPLLLAVPLWIAGVLLPGVTLSLCAIAGTAIVALERWWTLRTLGMRDQVTGFGNRLAFTRALEQRWGTRAERPLGLLLVDLSGFRRVNDLYGPGAGDEVLRTLSGRIGQHRRRGDLIFRWGSDEFAVLLDTSDSQDLASLTHRVQAALEDLSYRDVPLRASVGAALTGPEIRTPTDLVEAASRSRYRVKYQRLQREGSD